MRCCTANNGAASDGAELTAGSPFLRSSLDFPSLRELRRLATDGHRTGRSGGNRNGPNFLSLSTVTEHSGPSILRVSPSPSSARSGRIVGGSCSCSALAPCARARRPDERAARYILAYMKHTMAMGVITPSIKYTM